MRYAHAVTQAETLSAVMRDAQALIASLTSYASWLETLGTVEAPRGIVFHDLASATTVFSALSFRRGHLRL
jgi:coenzyme F420-reducing hydrogenase alpha subunit